MPVIDRRLSLTPLSGAEWRTAALCALLFPSWLEVAKWLGWRRGRAR